MHRAGRADSPKGVVCTKVWTVEAEVAAFAADELQMGMRAITKQVMAICALTRRDLRPISLILPDVVSARRRLEYVLHCSAGVMRSSIKVPPYAGPGLTSGR